MNYRRLFLQALFLFCEERGLATEKIASLSNISLREMNTKPAYSISNQQLEDIWKNIILLSKNKLVGFHFGTTMQIAALGVVGQVIQMSNNIKEALQHACSMIHLLTDFYTMQVEEKADLYSLSIESVAANFSLSVRTLQRKLKEDGVSYLQITEEVRKSLAIHYINKSSSSVKEISVILGYAQPSGFVRAFKNWTGKTPSEYKNFVEIH